MLWPSEMVVYVCVCMCVCMCVCAAFFFLELEIRQRTAVVAQGTVLLAVEDPKPNIGSGSATLNALLRAAEYLAAKEGMTVSRWGWGCGHWMDCFSCRQ